MAMDYIYMGFIKQVKYYKTKECELPMNDKPVNIWLEKSGKKVGYYKMVRKGSINNLNYFQGVKTGFSEHIIF